MTEGLRLWAQQTGRTCVGVTTGHRPPRAPLKGKSVLPLSSSPRTLSSSPRPLPGLGEAGTTVTGRGRAGRLVTPRGSTRPGRREPQTPRAKFWRDALPHEGDAPTTTDPTCRLGRKGHLGPRGGLVTGGPGEGTQKSSTPRGRRRGRRSPEPTQTGRLRTEPGDTRGTGPARCPTPPGALPRVPLLSPRSAHRPPSPRPLGSPRSRLCVSGCH